ACTGAVSTAFGSTAAASATRVISGGLVAATMDSPLDSESAVLTSGNGARGTVLGRLLLNSADCSGITKSIGASESSGTSPTTRCVDQGVLVCMTMPKSAAPPSASAMPPTTRAA